MDGARIRFDDALDGLELVEAGHPRPRFPRHAHATYALGAVAWGANRFRYRGATHVAPAGALCTVVPDEVHEVEPCERGFGYRCLYPGADLLRRAAAAVGRPAGGTLLLPPVIEDAGAARLIHRLFAAEAAGSDAAEREALLLTLVERVVRRHAMPAVRARDAERPAERDATRRAVARAREVLEARWAERVTLAELAEAGEVDPFTLLRAFSRTHGLPPHAWQLQERVRRAQRLLRDGHPPSEVAAATGFADQSHLHRHFRRLLGVTPGAYARAAWRPVPGTCAPTRRND